MNGRPPFQAPRRGASGAGTLPRGIANRPGGPRPPTLDKGFEGAKRVVTDVDWSISFVAFLAYIFVVITLRFGGATFFMAVAAGGLFFEKGQRRFPYWLGWMFAFTIWALVGYTQSKHQPTVWNEGIIEFAKVLLICTVAANVLHNSARLRFFMVFFLVLYATHQARGALFNAFIYGYTLQGRAVWNGSWSNPNDMAAYTFFPLAMAAALLKDRSDWIRKGAMASVAVLPLVIFMTRSRGAFLALGVVGALTVLTHKHRLKAIAGVGVVLLVSMIWSPAGTFERFNSFLSEVQQGERLEDSEDSSTRQRLEIWRVARRVINDYPIFGVGLRAYPNEHRMYAYFSAETRVGGGGRDVHSTYLRVLSETGYPGATLFLAPFVIAVIRGQRIRRKYGKRFPDEAESIKYVEAALMGMAVCALFGTYTQSAWVFLHVGLLSMLTEDVRRRAAQAARPPLRRGPVPPARYRPRAPAAAKR